MTKKLISVCIIGKDAGKYLSKCINSAKKISSKIIYVNLGLDDKAKSKVVELGASIVDMDSFQSAVGSDWILFLKPDEVPVMKSKKKLYSVLSDRHSSGYLVASKSNVDESMLNDYRFIKNLEQYKNIANAACITTLEPRLVKGTEAVSCLNNLVNETSQASKMLLWDTVAGLSIESVCVDESKDIDEDNEDHDKRCLKGEIFYGPVPGEGLDELSSYYIGYRILHKGHLDSFMEGARRGFGSDNMYLSMLDFLCKNGLFAEAKNLFEEWLNNRFGKETLETQITGANIYSNLLEIDSAIAWYKKVLEENRSAVILLSLGKLYCLKGDKEKALSYLKAAELYSNPLVENMIATISEKNWRMKTLTVCMIVKDEEKTIPRALESIEGIADEVIVVDTGSTDRTKEIVYSMGGRIIEAEWQDDFSIARNIGLAQATGDYILCLDADEYIDAQQRFSVLLLKALLPPAGQEIAYEINVKPDKDALIFSVSYLSRLSEQKMDEYQIRFFPGGMGVKFEGSVFESVYESLSRLGIGVAANNAFKIIHSKPDSISREQRKIRAVQKHFNCLTDQSKAFEGGLFFLKLGELEKAYPWFEKTENAEPKLLSRIAMLYTMKNQPDKAKKIIRRGLEHSPKSADLNFALAKVYHREEQYDKVLELLMNRINIIMKHLDPEYGAEVSYYYGTALLETGHIAEGIDHIADALEIDPLDTRYKLGGLYSFAKADLWEEVLEITGQITYEEKIKINYEVKDFCGVGLVFVELGRHFFNLGKAEEGRICQKISEHIISSKISKKEEVEKMIGMINAISI